jgi:hypothetical protein
VPFMSMDGLAHGFNWRRRRRARATFCNEGELTSCAAPRGGRLMCSSERLKAGTAVGFTVPVSSITCAWCPSLSEAICVICGAYVCKACTSLTALRRPVAESATANS